MAILLRSPDSQTPPAGLFVSFSFPAVTGLGWARVLERWMGLPGFGLEAADRFV